MDVYRFETYSLDARRGELRRGPDLVRLEPQVFDVLLYLVRNRDRVVSKDDLLAGVWGRRIVSESTLSSRITAVRHAVGDNGEQQRLVRTIRRKGYRFVGAVSLVEAQLDEDTARPQTASESNKFEHPNLDGATRPARKKPSIAVLPFASLSADPVLKYFIDGVVEDATTALSQFPWLFVVAPSSSFAYHGQWVDVRQAGRELGVRYVIEGSVRKVAEHMRVTARLVEAATGAHLWANSFDFGSADWFDLQDRVTARVVGAVGPKLERAEIERIKRKPLEHPDAYEFYLHGMSNAYQWTEAGMGEALRLFHQATESDPDFAPAYGMAAYCYVQRKSYGWFTDRSQEVAACDRLARRAAESGKEDAVTLARAAHALASVVGDFDSGVALIEQARRLSPNLSLGWYVSGWIRIFLGQPEVAIEHLTTALHLSPFDPLAFKMHAAIAYAHFFIERYDEASLSAGHAIRARPNYLTAIRGAAASHAFAGRLAEAQGLMAQMRQVDSALRLSELKNLIPLRRTGDLERWTEGLQKSGLPD